MEDTDDDLRTEVLTLTDLGISQKVLAGWMGMKESHFSKWLRRDLKVTKELMGHSAIRMTERYMLAAIPERKTAAVKAFERAVRKSSKK